MARPKKQDDARRTEIVAFRATPAERMQLEKAAIEAGLSASEYARRLALRGRVVVQQNRALDPAAFDELRRIGVNLNQLARIANQTGSVPSRLAAALASLEQILVREMDASRSGAHAAAPPPPVPRGP